VTGSAPAIKRISFAYAITIGALVAAGVIAERTVGVRKTQWAWVTHTFSAIQRIDAVSRIVAEADRSTAVHGAGADSLGASVADALAALRATVLDNPVQLRRVDSLSAILTPWHALAHADAGRLTGAMRAEEQRLLAARTAEVDKSSRRIPVAIFVILGVGLAVASAAAWKLARDIRAQQAADEAARETERDLTDFIENTSDIIYTTGPDGKLLYVNRAWSEVLGYTKDEAKNMWLSQVIHPDHLERTIALFHRIMAGEEMHNVDIDIISRDGRRRSVMGSSHRRMRGGAPVGTNSISTDVTERRAHERRVAESHSLVQAVLNSTSFMIVACDTVGTITGLNPPVERVLGRAEAELVGSAYVDVLFDGATFAEISAMALAHGREDREWTLRRHDGTTFPALVSISALRDAGGVHTGYAVIASDISVQKAAERTLLRATADAEQASRAKGEFLANMSHEIRTPMNAVIGLTGLLLDTALNDEQLEFVETIRAGGDTLLAIINDILDFSKIESGNLVLEAATFDVRDCVESALDLVAGRAAEKNVNLAYLVEDSVPQSLVGDVTRVRQVLVNFLSNAVKFTERGDVYVHVTSRSLTGGHVEAAVSVRDTGIGIPAGRIGLLFRSFSQVDASTTRQFGGTGLGLAISKRLVELMGGSVSVQSTPGEGSTFRFTIMVEPGEATRRTFLSGVAPELSTRRVLLVDDNATNRRILEQHLRGWGMHVCVAASGAEALEIIAREGTFDCGVFDMQMPVMDGEALAAAWRARPGATVPPLILVTSMGKRGSGGEKQFVTVLSKPVKPSLLYDTLVSTFTGASQRRPRSAARSIDHTTAARHPLRILLVEDNPVNQLVAVRMCEKFGYRVDVVGNGLEALAAVNHIPYDTVLMDVHMPEMDGLEATQRIRAAIPADRRPWIVAMTASAMESDRQACFAAGMDDYTPKPVTIDSLEGALSRAWASKGGAE
jgi:PAS domain S-box-containing protein